MDSNPQKESWSNFKKLTLYISVAIIFVLVLMAIFLL
ncbi:MAG: aa3-type cytochrome c oxidase subunit IV [Pelagibacteraceae bacterium]|nr:aa3-type cytochrome c oxidase subunit IV [Pelagibacteraceae bacterium]